ncbi:trafficking protein particle complex subunit 3 [Microdochium nivale]|nr:trafficking protein particle complex subunit 3 [Microdochium nivale]
MVAQLCKDFEADYVEVNKQLDRMGYNIGVRLIEDYLAKSNSMRRCSNFRETADAISKVRTNDRISEELRHPGRASKHLPPRDDQSSCGERRATNTKLASREQTKKQIGFKIFLNITPTITNWTSDSKQFSLVFEENPLADFVELPDDGRAQDELWFSNILCGVLRGALEMVQMQVEAHFISDVLRGNDTTEMRVSLIRYIDDEMPPDDD